MKSRIQCLLLLFRSSHETLSYRIFFLNRVARLCRTWVTVSKEFVTVVTWHRRCIPTPNQLRFYKCFITHWGHYFIDMDLSHKFIEAQIIFSIFCIFLILFWESSNYSGFIQKTWGQIDTDVCNSTFDPVRGSLNLCKQSYSQYNTYIMWVVGIVRIVGSGVRVSTSANAIIEHRNQITDDWRCRYSTTVAANATDKRADRVIYIMGFWQCAI